jgi:hypothetical protein
MPRPKISNARFDDRAPKPSKVTTRITVDHRIPAREIEAMILETFNVPMDRRYEVVRLALKISKKNGDYFLKIAQLLNADSEGRA